MRLAPPIARGLRLSVFEGSMFGVYWNVVAGVIINGLCLALGARPVHLAILNSLPLLGQVFGLFGARAIQSRDRRKPMVLLAEGVSRAVWALVPLVLLLPEGGAIRVWFVLAVAAASHATHAAGAVGWVSWIGDLVPEPIRGVYFGVRAAITGLVGVAGLTVASQWADGVRSAHGPGREYLVTLLALVGIALVFAGLSWLGLLLQPIRRMRRLVVVGWTTIWATLATPNGKRIALTWGLFAFSTGITTGVFYVFFLERLGMTFTGLTAYAWVALGVSTALTPLLGRFSDRFGHRNLLLLGWAGVFWQPLLCVFTPDDMPHLLGLMPVTILVDALAGGCFWPAMGVAQTNLVISEATAENRAGLFAVLAALAGIVGFVAAILGGLLADSIGPGRTFWLAGIRLDDLRLPMLLGSAFRFLTGLTILLIREPPRSADRVSSGQAFTIVWRVLAGKPVRPVAH